VALVTSLSLVQLFILFGTQLVLARFFGAGREMDALVAALAVPVVLAAILSGSIGYVLVPVFADRVAKHGQRDASAVASQIGIYLLGASLVAALIMAVTAQPIAAALCPGFSNPERQLTAKLLQVLAGLVVANTLVAFLNALHHCHHRFLAPAVAGVAGPLVTLGYIVLSSQQQGIFAVAWGIVAGAATTAILLLPLWIAALRELPADWWHPHSGTRQALLLLWPLLAGAILWRLDPLIDRWLGSYLSAGSIAHLGYAWRLTAALMMLGTSGLSIVAFPAIAAHAAAGRRLELSAEIAHALRLLVFLLVPVCLGLGLFAQPVVRLLFEHGKFTAADTQAVAMLLVLYLGVVVGASLGDVLSRTLYALHDTRTPVVVSTVVFMLAVGLKFLLVDRTAAAGLAAATSFYYAMNASALAAILLRRLGRDMLAGVAMSLVRCALCAAAACLVAWLTGQMWMPIAVVPAAISGAVSFALFAWLAGDEFAIRIGRYVDALRSTNNA